jgi:hypothetical protein
MERWVRPAHMASVDSAPGQVGTLKRGMQVGWSHAVIRTLQRRDEAARC